MDMLEKITEVLALKRSRAVREISQSKIGLQALDNRLATMEAQIFDISADVFSSATSDDPIGNAIMLERWQGVTLGNIRALRIERTEMSARFAIAKQTLKEILVKEDIVNSNLRAKKSSYVQECLESEASARLETWIVSRS